MRFAIGILSVLVLVATGCYPDAQYDHTVQKSSMRLSLSDLGIETDTQTVQRWLSWAGGGFDGEPFDMGVYGNDFALDLQLLNLETGLFEGFSGTSVFMDRQDGTDTLIVDLKISECKDCKFFVTLFWKENPDSDQVSVFDGESEEFSAVSSQEVVEIPQFSIVQTGTGTVTCNKGQQSPPDGSWLAVRDVGANIRFPHALVDSSQQPVAVLQGVPTLHTMAVELDPLSDGRFYSPFAEVSLSEDGENADVELP